MIRSNAFTEFAENQCEVIELLRSSPSDAEQLAFPKRRQLANALYRGSVVLLSSHLERYVESLVVETVDAINAAALPVTSIPEALQLTALKRPLRAAHEAEKLKPKVDQVRVLIQDYVWIWDSGIPCRLSAAVLVDPFNNPLPNRIRALFDHFGISDVVGKAVDTHEGPERKVIEAKVRELVDKRNAIAHSGMTSDVTRQDVVTYYVCCRRLVRGLDSVVGTAVEGITGSWPWRVGSP